MLYSNFVQNTYPKIIFDDDKFLEIYDEKNKNSNSTETIKAIRISVKYRHVYRPIIPNSIRLLFNLIKISLSGVSLSKQNIKSINTLIKLKKMHIEFSNISSELNFKKLVNLEYLYICNNTMNISSNQNNNTLDFIEKLTNIKHIKIINNKMKDSFIPSSLCNLMKVETLILNNNNLIGSIPENIGNLSNLVELSITRNKLQGNLPCSIGNIMKLKTLNLKLNKLSGPIPNSISNLTNLLVLDLSYNNFTEEIHPSLGKMIALKIVRLNNNNFINSIPISFSKLTNLNYLDLDHSQYNNNIENELNGLRKKVFVTWHKRIKIKK